MSQVSNRGRKPVVMDAKFLANVLGPLMNVDYLTDDQIGKSPYLLGKVVAKGMIQADRVKLTSGRGTTSRVYRLTGKGRSYFNLVKKHYNPTNTAQ